MDMSGIIDLLFLVSGVYLIGTALAAKAQGTISANVMLNKSFTEKDINDRAGFIEYLYKRILLSGVLIVLASIVHLANDYYFASSALTWLGSGMILLALVIYVVSYKKCQKMYVPKLQALEKKSKKRDA